MREIYIKIQEKAYKEGFFFVGFLSEREASKEFKKFYLSYIKKGYHGFLKYLSSFSRIRKHFFWKKLFPFHTIGVFAYPYYHPITQKLQKKSPWKIALYAWGEDYHRVLKEKIQKILKEFGLSSYKILVDSSPFPERYVARKAGLGFIGRNALLIHPRYGSYFFLAFALIGDKKIPPYSSSLKKEKPIEKDWEEYCKNCTRCMDACPTHAIIEPGLVDARRCLSSLTIEYKGDAFFPLKGRWIFGCDICQMVCPYNKDPILHKEERFLPILLAKEVAKGRFSLSKKEWRRSPLSRAGKKYLKRNQAWILSKFRQNLKKLPI